MKNRIFYCGKFSLSITLTAALIGLFCLTACFAPLTDTNVKSVTNFNTVALSAVIAEAEAERDAVIESVNGRDVTPGAYWVSPSVKTSLKRAIVDAKRIRDTAGNQNEIDNATAYLENEIRIFRFEKRQGNVPAIEKIVLEVKIVQAENIALSITVAEDGDDVALRMYWVTAKAMTDFETAISAAIKARDTATSQTVINTAEATLDSAIADFIAKRQEGTKASGFDTEEFTALINAAKTAKKGIKTSTSGDDVGPLEFWVSNTVLENLNDTISAAEHAWGTLDSTSHCLALVQAINDFNAVKNNGTIPDKSILYQTIEAAETAKIGVVAAQTRSAAPLGMKWVNTAIWESFSNAYNNATNAYISSGASKKTVDEAESALDTAINDFTFEVNGNEPGTKPTSVTITGLKFKSGTAIQLSLYTTPDEFQENSEAAISGSGTILNEITDIPLTITGDVPWNPSGLWFVSFYAENDKSIYISRYALDFASASNPVVTFLMFRKIAFSSKLGDIAEGVFTTPSQTMALDQWIDMAWGGSYTDYLGWNDLKWGAIVFYKNESLSVPFNGSDTVNANTVIYTNYPAGRGAKTGEISGTITLTGMPVPAPLLTIYAEGTGSLGFWKAGSRISGSEPSFNWTIPLHERDNFSPSNGSFKLHIQSGMGDKGFYETIPGTKSIVSENVNVGDLGTIAVGNYITLSGTLNLTVDGKAPPLVEIVAYEYGSVRLSSPGTNASWSIVIEAPASLTEIYLNAIIYPKGSEDWFSAKCYEYDYIKIDVSNASQNNITLDFGNIKTYTLSGTISASHDNKPVPRLEIIAGGSANRAGFTLYSPKMNAPWVITMADYGEEYGITFYATGYPESHEEPQTPLFEREIAETQYYSIWVSNVSIDKINLQVGSGIPSYPEKAIPLEADSWVDGEITENTAGGDDWYSINVSQGTFYNLWWNANSYEWSGFTGANGDGSKLLKVEVNAWYGDGREILLTDNYFAWQTPVSFTSDSNDIVYIRVRHEPNTYIFDLYGTYSIVYSTGSNRPYNFFNPGKATPLNPGSWFNGIINRDTGKWHTINVTQGTSYYLWWNDKWEGDGTKAADIKVYARYANGTMISLSNNDTAWKNPVTFTAASTGIVYILSLSSVGSYGIVYDTVNTRPSLP